MDAMRRELVHAKQTIEKLEERDQICMTKECVSSGKYSDETKYAMACTMSSI